MIYVVAAVVTLMGFSFGTIMMVFGVINSDSPVALSGFLIFVAGLTSFWTSVSGTRSA